MNLREIARNAYTRGAVCVVRNITSNTSMTILPTQETHTVNDLEEHLLSTHASALNLDRHDGVALTRALLRTLAREQGEGERQAEYRDSIIKDALAAIHHSRRV
jgi:hypothetical protein